MEERVFGDNQSIKKNDEFITSDGPMIADESISLDDLANQILSAIKAMYEEDYDSLENLSNRRNKQFLIAPKQCKRFLLTGEAITLEKKVENRNRRIVRGIPYFECDILQKTYMGFQMNTLFSCKCQECGLTDFLSPREMAEHILHGCVIPPLHLNNKK